MLPFVFDVCGDDFVINIERSKFSISDQEDFTEAVNHLKSYYIFYSNSVDGWKVDQSKIEELLAWFEKRNVKYRLTDEAKEFFEYYKSVKYKSDVIYSRSRKFNDSILNEDATLYNYQIEGINWRLKRNAYLDAYDPGLGKTVINICVFSTLFNNNEIDSIFLCVPNDLEYHWQHEILKFVNVFKEDDIVIIDNKNKKQPFEKFQDKKIMIVPHSLLSHVILSYKNGYKFGQSAARFRWKEYVNLKEAWNKKNIALVIDESHIFKSSEAVRSKALNSVRNSFDFRFLLSATPSINAFENIYNQINFIDRSVIPMSEKAFRIWVSRTIGDNYNKYKIRTYNPDRVDETKHTFQRVFTQKLKDELPEMKTRQIVLEKFVKFNDTQQRLYNLVAEEEFKKLLDEYDFLLSNNVQISMMNLAKVIDNVKLLENNTYENKEIDKLVSEWDIEDDPKFKLLKSRIDEYIGVLNEKVIVYDFHPKTLDALAEKFKEYKPLVIHGSLPVKDKREDRRLKEQLFNNDPKHKVMFLSSLTSSAGLNLQKMCHRIIFYSCVWDATLIRQGMDRTHRINSTNNSIIEFLIADKSLDIVRVNTVLNRINLNNVLGKTVSFELLQKLLNGRTN